MRLLFMQDNEELPDYHLMQLVTSSSGVWPVLEALIIT